MLYLVVKPSEQPGCVPAQHSRVIIKIHSRRQLVLHGGVPNESPRVPENESSAFDAVGELEDHRESESHCP